jgi:hypothetical protein
VTRVVGVKVTYAPGETVQSGSIREADARMLQHPACGARYEYEVTWEDGTKHLSRSREPTIAAALAAWLDNFTNGPAGKSEAERAAYLAKVDPGIREHLRRLVTGELEHS